MNVEQINNLRHAKKDFLLIVTHPSITPDSHVEDITRQYNREGIKSIFIHTKEVGDLIVEYDIDKVPLILVYRRGVYLNSLNLFPTAEYCKRIFK